MAVDSADANDTTQAQLRCLFEKFAPAEQDRIHAIRTAVRRRLPTANELVYDYGTFFVIGYSPTQQPTDGIVSLAARPDGVRLYFMHGPKLPDPEKLLLGSGKETRFIRVDNASRVTDPEVEALIAATIERANVPLPATGSGEIVIRTFGGKRQSQRKKAT